MESNYSEEPDSNSPDAPEHLFTLKCEATVHRDFDGRTRRFERIPMQLEANRETTPVDPKYLFEGDVPDQGREMLTAFFTMEEALAVAQDLSEKDARLENVRLSPLSVPLSYSEDTVWRAPLRTFGAGTGDLVLYWKIDGVEVLGWGHYNDAETTEWKDAEIMEWTKEMQYVTLQVPKRMAAQLRSKEDPAGYLFKIEKMAQLWKKSTSDLPS